MQFELYQGLVEQAPDAIIFADPAGTIRVWNAAAARLFGLTADLAIGANLDCIIPERFRPAHWAGFHRALDAGTTRYAGQVMTTRAVDAGGQRCYVALSFALVRDGAGGIVGVMACARSAPAPAATG